MRDLTPYVARACSLLRCEKPTLLSEFHRDVVLTVVGKRRAAGCPVAQIKVVEPAKGEVQVGSRICSNCANPTNHLKTWISARHFDHADRRFGLKSNG